MVSGTRCLHKWPGKKEGARREHYYVTAGRTLAESFPSSGDGQKDRRIQGDGVTGGTWGEGEWN